MTSSHVNTEFCLWYLVGWLGFVLFCLGSSVHLKAVCLPLWPSTLLFRQGLTKSATQQSGKTFWSVSQTQASSRFCLLSTEITGVYHYFQVFVCCCFFNVLWIRTHLHNLMWQARYQVNHLPSPVSSFLTDKDYICAWCVMRCLDKHVSCMEAACWAFGYLASLDSK